MQVAAVRDAITFYEQAWHLMDEHLHDQNMVPRLSGPKIEHLYTHLGQAYELNAEWEKARAVYKLLLTYSRDSSQSAVESTTLKRLATLTSSPST